MKQFRFFYLISVILIIFAVSCEVGLGEAVDTQEPNIATETPPVDAIIRGKFAVGGTWTDDGQANSAKIELRRTDNNTVIEYDGSLSSSTLGQGLWSVVIDPMSSSKPVKDGKYEIVVTVYDAAGHSSKDSRLITIDNTAPLILLDRPASRPDETEEEKKMLDAYGQKLSILGRAADDNSVDSIDINFYKDGADKPVHTVRKTGVSNTIDETVAVFGDENYDKIYGSSKNGTSYYTCSIKAYDKARRYPDSYPAHGEIKGEDLLGNRADHYYLFSELSSTLLKDFTVTELYKMLSGNYEPGSNRAAEEVDVQSILNKLLEKKVDVGKFKLNPENNPVYSVSGYETVSSWDNFSQNKQKLSIKAGSRISIDVSPGIDGYALKKPFNSSVENESDNYKIVFYPCRNGSLSVDTSKDSYTVPNGIIGVKFQGGAYKVVVPLEANYIEKFDNYILRIEGKDSLGNELIAVGGGGNEYVFNFEPSDVPPVLYVKKIDDYYNKNKPFVLEGHIKNAGVSPVLKIELNGMTYKYPVETTPDLTSDYYFDSKTGNYKYTFKSLPLENDRQYSVKVTAEAGSSADTELTFIYDTTPPKGEVDDTIKNNSKWFKFKQVPLKLNNVTDISTTKEVSGVEVVSASSGSGFATLTNRNGVYQGNIEVSNEGKNTVNFTLRDKAGNENKLSTEVNVDTIAPNVSLSDVKVDGTSKKSEATKLIDGKKDVIVELDIQDGEASSGIQKIELTKLCGLNPSSFSTKKEDPTSGNSIYRITIDKSNFPPNTASTGSVEFKITDNAGNITNFNAFNMTIDNAGPKSSIGIIPDADLETPVIDVNKTIKINGTLFDDNGLASAELQYKKKDGGSWKKYKEVDLIYNWNVSVDTSSFDDNTIYLFRVEAKDKAGYESFSEEKEVKINQDSDRPVITLNDIDLTGMGPGATQYAKSRKDTIVGSIFDDDNVTDFWYKEGVGDYQKIDVRNGSWSISPKQGVNQIYFKVTDKAGATWISGDANKPKLRGSEAKANDYSILHIFVDTQEPIITETLSKSVTKGNESGAIVLGGKVRDNIGFPADCVVVTIDDGKQYKCGASDNGSETDWTVTIPANDAKDGDHVITIKATDKAGNEHSLNRNILVDRIAPDNFTGSVETEGSSLDSSWYNSTQLEVKVSGITENGSGVSTVTASVQDGKSMIMSPNGDGTYSGLVTVTENNSGKDITFTVKDAAGNEKSKSLSGIKVDTTQPSVSLESVDGFSVTDAEKTNGAYNKLSNAEKDVTVKLNPLDSGSGIEKVELITLCGKPLESSINSQSDKKTIIIPKEKMADSGGKVSFRITDKAGNEKTFDAFSMTIDKTAPVVDFGNISDADPNTPNSIEVNKVIKLSGTIQEANKVDYSNTYLQYAKSATEPTQWTKLTDTDAGAKITFNGSLWNANVDTSKLGDGDCWFRLVATDEAGNTNTSGNLKAHKVNINQDSDRPVITLNDIDLTGMNAGNYAKSQKDTISGLLFDDDGVETFEYGTSATGPFDKINVRNGSWSINPTQGENQIYFKITDKSGAVWISEKTKDEQVAGKPKLSGSETSKNEYTVLHIFVDTEAPIITETKSKPVTKGDENGAVVLGGNVKDNIGFPVNSIVVKSSKIEKSYTCDVGTAVGGGDTPWSVTILGNEAVEGDHVITIKVSDKAGNEASLSRNIKVDKTKPEGTGSIETAGKTVDSSKWYKSTQLEVKVSGIAEAGSGVANVTATVEGNNPIMLSPNDDSTYSGYVTVSEGNDARKVTFTVSDVAGNQSTSEVTGIKIDTTQPSVSLVKVDGKDVEAAEKTNGAYNKLSNASNAMTVELNPVDNGSDISKVELITLCGKPASIVSGDKKTITVSKEEMAKCEGNGKVTFKVTDNAGNEKTFDAFSITIDKTAPVVDFGNISDADPDTDSIIDVNKKVTFTGSIKEVNKLDESAEKTYLQYAEKADSPGDGDWHTVTTKDNKATVTLNGSMWSVNVDTTKFNEGDCWFRLVATDEAGNIGYGTQKKVKINQDSDRPIITLNDIDLSGMSKDKYAQRRETEISGSIFDDDGAIKELWYNLDGSDTFNHTVPIKNGSWSISVSDDYQGERTAYIKIVDVAGSTWISEKTPDSNVAGKPKLRGSEPVPQDSYTALHIFVDSHAPIITETQSTPVTKGADADAGNIKKGDIVLGGIVKDNIGLPVKCITVTSSSIKDSSGKLKEFKWDNSDISKLPESTEVSEEWSVVIPSSESGEGNHGITITVTDKAGHKSSLSRNILVDRTPPTGDVSIETVINNNWYQSSQLKVKVSNIGETGSGVANITARVGNGDISTLSPTTITSPEGVSKIYVGYITVPEGSGKAINFEITDNAGNSSTITKDNVNIDTNPPEASLMTVDGVTLNSAKLVNGKKDVTVLISASDSTSGISNVSLKSIIGNPVHDVNGVKEAENYKVTIKGGESGIIPTTSGSGSVIFEITDNAGNKKELNAFTMTVDTAAPETKIQPLQDAYNVTENGKNPIDVNKVITISGTASDNNGVSKVQLQYGTVNNSTNDSDWTNYGSPIIKQGNNSITSWKFDVNTEEKQNSANLFNDNTIYYFRALATDDAGNTNATSCQNIELNINQNSDRPIIAFTNLTLPEGEALNKPILFDNTKLYGTISDDDGISEVYYKIVEQLPADGSSVTWTESDKLTLGNGGTWNIKLGQGEQFVLFKVIDNNSKSFESTSANNFEKIKIAGLSKSSLSLKVDTIAPALGKIKYQIVDDPKNFVEADPETKSKWKQFAELSEEIIGGVKNRYIYFKIPATDKNGIASIVLEGDLTGGSSLDKINCNVNTGISTPIDTSTFKKNPISDSVLFPLSLTVTDGAEKTTNMDINLIVDNKAPVLTVDSHKSGDNIRSDFLLKGLTDDSKSKIEYVITDSKDLAIDDPLWNTNASRTYNIEGSRMSWGIHFDKKSEVQTISSTPDERMHDLNPKGYFFNVYKDKFGLGKNDNGAIITTATNELYTKPQPLYFHFRLTDELGNSSINNDFNLIVDPQGGMPVVKLTYPTLTSEGDAPTVSGTIRLQGTADDDKQITDIYMQLFKGELIPGTNDVDPDSLKPMTKDQYGSNYTVEDLNGMSVIKVGKGLTWNFNINEKGDFNGADGSINVIALSLFAKDDDGQISEGTVPFALKIDSTSPRIGSSIPFTLNQYKWVDGSGNFVGYSKTADGGALYDDAGCNSSNGKNSNGNYQAFNTIDYESGMWLKGIWWLNGSVEDESGIVSIVVNNSDIPAENKKEYKNASVNTSGFEITYKIDYSSMSNGEIKIVATDNDNNGGKTSTEIFNVNYDNDPPTISDENKDNTSVINDNGFFTLKSSASEDGSGFDRAVFYFTSRDKNTVYDSYIKKGATGHTLSKNNVSDNIVEDMGLFWRKESGTVSGNTITLTNTNPNIHVGGLIKLKGALYTIGNISGNAVSVTTNIPEIKGSTDVYFAIGHVVDHWGTETPGSIFETNDNYYGYYKDIPDDDKDRMVEKVSEIGNKITWNGSINSNNIPDGPLAITYVVFDKAGNYSTKTITGKAENNAPRLASLGVWSDYNRDDVQDEGEVNTFYFAEAERIINGKIVLKATNITRNLIVSGNKLGPKPNVDGQKGFAYKTIKDEFTFIPELVGGNGKLWYTYNIDGNKPNTPIPFMNGRFDGIDDNPNDGIGYLKIAGSSSYVSGYTGNIKVDSTLLNKLDNSVDSKNPTWFTYTISDSTGTPGENTYNSSTSLSAVFNVALNVQYKDSDKPTVSIKPFYWNSNTDNSISGNNPENGHIELSGDLDPNVFNASSGLFDKDAKVSGRIRIEGTAADNIKLKELYVKFPGINDGKRLLVASYDATKGTWTSKKDETNKWTFTAVDGEHKNESGEPWHNVNWTFDVDTTIVSGTSPVGLDQLFEITAKDERGTDNTSNTGLESVSDTNSQLRMDVVPYITGVNTSLSNLKKNNPSVFGRTAKGHYPVAADEEVIFVGFNLEGATYRPANGKAIKLISTDAKDCVPGLRKGKSFVKLPVSNITTSGPIELKVGEITTLNNYNNNEAKGGAKDKEGATITLSQDNYKQYAYNRQPNGDNNNLLTDDVYFDVWQFYKETAIVKEAGYIVEPIMKINPKNDMVSFAFNNGPAYFSMPDGQNNSYTLWQGNYARNTTTGFTIDSNGNTHGITVGLDTNPTTGNLGGHAGRMTYMYSGWGVGDPGTDGNYNGYRTSRIDSIGVPAGWYNGINYRSSVFLEDRFKSPSLATIVRDKDTYVYLAYYDDLNQQIRFRWGDLAKSTAYKGEKGYTFNQFADQTAAGNNRTGNDVFKSSDSYYSVVAGSSTAAKAGEYVSIAVVPGTSTLDDVVVMTWYDAINQAWMYSYKVNPNNDKDMGGPNSWVTPVVLKENAGQHCKITVDGNNGIHIAAQDSFNSDLNYIYLPSYSSTSNVSVKTVDAAGLTGSNITLDVAIKGNYIIPYIGYYANSIGKPKVAYLPDTIPADGSATSVAVPDGDINESFTGSWECSVVPTTSSMRDDYINVGVWKDSKGVWKPASTGTTGITTGASSIDGDTGKCYGNGTQNPILGYATKIGTSGRIETAQMK